MLAPFPPQLAGAPSALLHFRRCAGDEAFFAAFESAWRNGLLSKAARSRVRAALPASARWLVSIARPDAAASTLGYETLRFDYAQIVHDWPTVQAAIVGALRRLELRR